MYIWILCKGDRAMEKVVLITGGSSGIGYATAELLARNGYKVYAGARRIEKMEPLKKFGVIPISSIHVPFGVNQ